MKRTLLVVGLSVALFAAAQSAQASYVYPSHQNCGWYYSNCYPQTYYPTYHYSYPQYYYPQYSYYYPSYSYAYASAGSASAYASSGWWGGYYPYWGW